MNGSRLENVGSAAAGIAHDINNQLNLIVNHLEGARRAAAHCSALTGSLLAYCKGEAIEICATDPGKFLRNFVKTLPIPAAINLHLEARSPLPAIMADHLALARVLTNLISNACDAMEDQGTLTLTACPRKIEVRDSGPGIPAENLQHVFDPFFTTKGSAGTGLGLSIVRELMRQQGGSVTVRSQPGEGARFALHFRAA
jgi:signal transduction histidine kinase